MPSVAQEEPPIARRLVIAGMPESDVATSPTFLQVSDWLPGNAATRYQALIDEKRAEFEKPGLVARLYGVDRATPDELRADPLIQELVSDAEFFSSLESAARRRFADWSTSDASLDELASTPRELVKIQQFAYVLSAYTRLKIADGDIPEAIRATAIAFGMTRHLSHGITLGHARTALGNYDRTLDGLAELVQHPQAPNLFWALTSVPTPLVDLGSAWRWADTAPENSFPWIAELEITHAESSTGTKAASTAEWNTRLQEFVTAMEQKVLRQRKPGKQFHEHLVFGYPLAKERLIQLSYSADRVENMSAAQVLLLDAFVSRRRSQAQILKCFGLPFWQSYPLVKKAEVDLDDLAGFGFRKLASSVQSSPSQMLTYSVAIHQKLCMLCVVEALRMAIARDGHLPHSLAEMTSSPCPVDPVTGKPFTYESDGQRARLDAAALMGPAARWEIELRKPDDSAKR